MGGSAPEEQTLDRARDDTLRLRAAALLVLASLATLPVVYVLVRDEAMPAYILFFGLLAIGLGWGGGLLIERRRRTIALLMAGLGAVLVPAAFLPELHEARAFAAGGGLLALLSLVPGVRTRA